MRGEQGMKEKPFKDDFEYKTRIMNYLSAMSCGDPMGVTENIFRLIEADREAIRAETREECEAERIMMVRISRGKVVATVGLMPEDSAEKKEELILDLLATVENRVRRAPKRRAMTKVEMVSKVRESYSIRSEEASQLKETTLVDLLQNRGISTEVDE